MCTTSGEAKDLLTGKMIKVTFVVEVKDKDTNPLMFKMPGPDGKEFAAGVIACSRKR